MFFVGGDMSKMLQLGCSLGVTCYCLAKQVQQYGSSNSGSSGKGGKSSSSISSTKKGSSHGSSKGKGGVESSATASSTNSSSSSQKWGGLQLELPPSVMKSLQEVEGRMTGDALQTESAFKQAVSSNNVGAEYWVPLLGDNTEGLEELLKRLLGLCEGFVAAVPVPLGCNNPSCINLDGVSEASAAKV